MRKILLVLSVLALLTTGASTASAQNEIGLGGSSANSLAFTGNGSGGWTLTFSPNPLDGAVETATGVLAWGPISGFYEITSSGALTGVETASWAGGGSWNISGSALGFSICPTKSGCGAATALLTGNLQLVSLQQDGKSGTFNYNATADLTITGGKYASLITNGEAIVQISIDLPSGVSLASLKSGQTENGRISSGEINPTPEPASMVLVGSGLILLGGLLRRARRWTS